MCGLNTPKYLKPNFVFDIFIYNYSTQISKFTLMVRFLTYILQILEPMRTNKNNNNNLFK
jgi:hypothetical protein